MLSLQYLERIFDPLIFVRGSGNKALVYWSQESNEYYLWRFEDEFKILEYAQFAMDNDPYWEPIYAVDLSNGAAWPILKRAAFGDEIDLPE